MFTTIGIYMLLALISLFPIVIWAYIFSYIDNNPLNKKRFFVGVLGGALSVVPILYMGKILDVLQLKYLNIFYFISQIGDWSSGIELAFSLSLFLLLIVGLSFVLGLFIKKSGTLLKVYLKNVWVFILFILLLSLGVYFFNLGISAFDFEIANGEYFGEIFFNSFKLIIFYYLLVSFIEETSKHFNFLQSSVLYVDSIKTGVLYSIFVALGFSLIENMLYLYNFYTQVGVGGELLKLFFFRSVFSVIVHVLCSSVVAYYFSKALMMYREHELGFPYFRIFIFGLLISILLHLIFDVALTFGFSVIMFIYFIGGYLYVSNLFYKEE